ncbi:response regulator [Aquabacterium sp. A7-Y]|uniref:response regulator n=1 Tax=Aquabacterium sp. A7-Y TaxID=1349605 RepID=UPI00223E503B|nr:response regulator [Aquabacterium sp. A7-Y]MCW7536258.1 response regulator [Aquabacterium sp. A7-Y]
MSAAEVQIVQSPPVAATTRATRVLIVDDHADLADSLAAVLQLKGYEACSAYDGQQGLEVARRFEPDMVVLDLNMPVMDGYEAAESLRQTRGWGVILVAMTGAPEWETMELASISGFDAHLSKPVDSRDLEGVLIRIRSLKAVT